MITSLKKDQVFVYGSNLNGMNYGGAARYAEDHFGAKEGIGEGMNGPNCYAFPTLGVSMGKRMRWGLETSVKKFYKCAEENPDKEFLLTPVGTGIASYTLEDMKSLFVNPPKNVVLPPEFL